MALPVAHAAVGWSLALVLASPKRLEWRTACLVALLTVVADFDLLAVFLFGHEGHYWHHTVTHTWFFGILAAVAASLVFRWRRGSFDWAEAALVGVLVASHTLVDYWTIDESFPCGVPMFWPLSVEFYVAPEPLFLNIHRSNLATLFGSHNARALLREILFSLPLLALSLLWWRLRSSTQPLSDRPSTVPQEALPS